MFKSIMAIVVGFLVTGALAVGTTSLITSARPGSFDANGVPTSPTMMLVNLAYVGVFAIFGCWLAGKLAPNRAMRHALIVGVLGLILNVGASIPLRNAAPAWFIAAGVLTTMLWAWIGGRLAERRPTPAAA